MCHSPVDAPLPFPSRARRRIAVDVHAGDDAAARLEDALLALARAVDPRARIGHADVPWTELSFVAVDVETTGFQPDKDRVIELAWVRFEGGREVERFASLVHAPVTVPYPVRRLTGIDNAMLADKPAFEGVAAGLVEALAGADFAVAYNARFDRGFLGSELARAGLAVPDVPWVDPLVFLKEIDGAGGHKLTEVARRFDVACPDAHRAESDARTTGRLLLKMAPRLGAHSLAALLDKQARWSRLPPTTTPEPRTLGARLLSLFR